MMNSMIAQDMGIFFGDKYSGVAMESYTQMQSSTGTADMIYSLLPLTVKNQVRRVAFLRQVHGAGGYAVDDFSVIPFFDQEGDFLITHLSGVGLGIMTADCLPVIVYDPVHTSIGIAHAGWRGAVAGVVDEMILSMKQRYGTNPRDLNVFFGSSARGCCYQVGVDLVHYIASQYRSSLIYRGDNIFFDAVVYQQLRLIEQGVECHHIVDRGVCTICDNNYYSYRREKEGSGRNITMVWLR